MNDWKWDHYVVNASLDAANVSSIGFAEKASTLFRSLSPHSELSGVKLTDGRSATEQAVLDAFRRREGKTQAVGFAGANHGQGLAMT